MSDAPMLPKGRRVYVEYDAMYGHYEVRVHFSRWSGMAYRINSEAVDDPLALPMIQHWIKQGTQEWIMKSVYMLGSHAPKTSIKCIFMMKGAETWTQMIW